MSEMVLRHQQFCSKMVGFLLTRRDGAIAVINMAAFQFTVQKDMTDFMSQGKHLPAR
ncbi:hypothetical protein ElyMa_005486200 [Elysia marginata]|uniref:Uncharacterized protein n=1 Tax=Elysia marginata TaxID=1093978 RepID=A0AAV4ESD7_9GAST|nr:hypothetical protein ElyMa_005486200 [Elysia marginata]